MFHFYPKTEYSKVKSRFKEVDKYLTGQGGDLGKCITLVSIKYYKQKIKIADMKMLTDKKVN